MKINVTKAFKASKLEIQIEDSDDKKALMKALIFTQPDNCGLCNSIAIWDFNKAQTDDGDFIYIKRICTKCGAQSVMGDYKGGGHFWKKWEIWKPDSSKGNARSFKKEVIDPTPPPVNDPEPKYPL